MRRVALTIGGADSSGGAGVQADLAAFAAFGVHGATALVAVTAQRLATVDAVLPLPPAIVRAQIDAAFADLPVAAVKIGLVPTPELVETVAALVVGRRVPIVLDPVLVASAGTALAAPEVADALRALLLPSATVITPNLAEAARLSDLPVHDPRTMERAGRALLAHGPQAVLVTGGHLPGHACDVLVTASGCWELEVAHRPLARVRGTGCLLAAAIAAGLAHDVELLAAVRDAKAYLTASLDAAWRVRDEVFIPDRMPAATRPAVAVRMRS